MTRRTLVSSERLFAFFFSNLDILFEISSVISLGRFACATALASCLESSKLDTNFELDEPHLVQDAEWAPLHPNEWPQSHLCNCHASVMNTVIRAGTSLCRDKDEHLCPA